MTKKTRTILFLICFFLFLLISPSVILYSLGYRFDFDSKKIVKTGAFYFKVWPKNVEIYLNEKLKKKTNFFFGSALIDNLLPKKYDVEIKKEGFYSWKKNLEIKEKEVTESKNVFLIPENPKFEIFNEGVENFFFSPDEKKIILKRNQKNSWVLEFFDLERNKKSSLFEGSSENEFLNLNYSQDSKKIFFKIKEKGGVKNFIFEFEKGNLISLDFLAGDIEKISFNPKNEEKIFFIKGNNLFEANILKKELNLEPILKDLITYQISNSNFFWISKEGYLFKTDFSGKFEEKINLEPFPLKEEKEYKIYLKLPQIFLKESDILYFFDLDLKSFWKLFEPIKEIRFSPDEKKMLFFGDYEIWILFLEKKFDQPQKEAGEKLFLTRFSEKIENCFWWTSHYLIFSIGNKIKIAEIDDRDRINIVDLAEFKEPEIFFNQFDKKLYLLSGGNLFFSEKLLP